jgi:hypothetical protein
VRLSDVPGTALDRLQQRVRVVGNQADDLLVYCAAAQIPGAVERVESGVLDGRRVPDVMQPGRSNQNAVTVAEAACRLFSLAGDTLHVCPAAGQRAGQQAPRQLTGLRHRCRHRLLHPCCGGSACWVIPTILPRQSCSKDLR